MSRRANFTRALASGYGTMLASAIYSIISVPIALAYLNRAEFGLWALVTQIGTYWTLIDLGMSGSILRILIDHKDDKPNASYGTVFKTGLIVATAQGLFIACAGSALAPWLVSAFHVPPELRSVFIKLLIGQSICAGIFQPSSSFSHLLTAHQRYDIGNLSQILSFGCGFAALWISFRYGCGVFSLLWALVAASSTSTILNISTCVYLGLMPPSNARGTFSMPVFLGLFRFGMELFLQALGWQLLSASQIMLVSHFVGLEAAATYVVCFKPFALVQQAIWRIFDFSTAGLSEMVARSEFPLVRSRFIDLLVLTGGASVLLGFATASCNQAFVNLWTQGRVGWPPLNDWLLAGVTVSFSVNRTYGVMAWVMKKTEQTRYIYFIEGLVFISLAITLVGRFGIPGLLAASIVSDCAISGVFGLRQTAVSLQLNASRIARQGVTPVFQFLLAYLPLALGIWALTNRWQPLTQFVTNGTILIIIGTIVLWCIGISQRIRNEILAMLLWRSRNVPSCESEKTRP